MVCKEGYFVFEVVIPEKNILRSLEMEFCNSHSLLNMPKCLSVCQSRL